jgi:hypothetical protein
MRKAYRVIQDEAQCRSIVTEHNDCTVRAYASAFNLTYAESHAILKACGRRNRRGFHLNSFMKSMHSEIKPIRPRQTIYSFINSTGSKGTWIVWIRRHVFAVRDGVALDLMQFPAGSRIIAVWKCDKLSWYCGAIKCGSEYEATILSTVTNGKVEYK